MSFPTEIYCKLRCDIFASRVCLFVVVVERPASSLEKEEVAREEA